AAAGARAGWCVAAPARNVKAETAQRTRTTDDLSRQPGVPADRAAELLNAPVWKAMVTLSVHIVLANLLQTVYQLTDTFWLGRVGPEAVADVSLSFPIIFLLISLGGGLAVAG